MWGMAGGGSLKFPNIVNLLSCVLLCCAVLLRRAAPRRVTPRMCGIIGIFKYEGPVNVELYEGLLMLQHRGQDSAGMVTTDWNRFKEYKENGLVKDVFAKQDVMDSMTGG